MKDMQTQLNKKTISWIVGSVSLLAGAICLIFWFTVMSGFSKLEQNFVKRNISRTQEVIDDAMKNLGIKLSDWAKWDDTYAFIEDKNETYIKANLMDIALENLQINMMGFFNLQGEPVYFMDNSHDGKMKLLLPEGLGKYLAKGSPFLNHPKEKSFQSGIVMLPGGPLIVVAAPILKTDGTGPIRGTIIFAKYLNPDELERLGGIIKVDIEMQRIDADSMPADFKIAQSLFLKGNQVAIEVLDNSTIAGYSILKDVYGKEIMILRTSMPREITQFGHRVLWYFIFALIVVGLIFGIAVYLPLNREISGRYQAEKQLTRLKERFEQVTEHAREMIWEVDETGMYTYMSQAVKDILGYERGELVGKKHFYDLHPESGREAFKTAAFAVFERKEPFQDLKNTMQSKDGRQVQISTNGIPLLNADGTLRGYVGSDTDITEHKRAEAQREEIESQLRQSQKMDAIGQLAGGIAHDFNNQLAIIMGYAEMLYKAVEDPALKKKIEKILRSSERSAEMTKNLLAFSRKGKYMNVPVNIHEVIDEIVALLSHTIDKRIKIKREFNASSPMILGDPSQIHGALLNLALNSRDAMPDEGELVFSTDNIGMEDVPLGAEERRKAVAGRHLKISVIDNGIGMDNNVKVHIFEPFFTTKPQGQGTGMGLASVYGIVQKHNGVINVKSSPGKGAEFSLFFPVFNAEAEGVEKLEKV